MSAPIRRPRLTRYEKDAVCTVLNEFLAGHGAEEAYRAGFADSEKEGEKFVGWVVTALKKLEA